MVSRPCGTSPPARRLPRSRACPTPTRRAFSFATRKAPSVARSLKSRALTEYLQRRRGFDVERDVPVLHRLRGRRAPRRRASARPSGGSSAVTAGCASGLSRRALRPEEVRHAVHPGLPARPRRARRRLRDRGALEPAVRRSTTPSWPPPTARSTSSASAATSCATCRTRTTPAPACTSPSPSCPAARSDGLAQYDLVKSAIQQAFIDSGATLSHHHAVGTEHPRWLEEDISAPGVAMLRGAVRRRGSGSEPQPREDRVSRSDGRCRHVVGPQQRRRRRSRGGAERRAGAAHRPLHPPAGRSGASTSPPLERSRRCSWPTTRATWTPRPSCERCRGVAPAHGGRGGGRLLLPRPLARAAWCRWPSTRFPWSAREREPFPTPPRCSPG